MKIPSPVEMNLLATLVRGELAGREVAKAFKEETDSAISYGTLYTTFRRMQEHGWVDSHDDEESDGRVRYFRLTLPGSRALAAGRAFYVRLARAGLSDVEVAA